MKELIEHYSKGIKEFEQHMNCSMSCGMQLIHPWRIVINMGGLIFIIERKKLLTMAHGTATGKGVSVWVEYFCECGASYAQRIQFHKGTSWVAKESSAPDLDMENNVPLVLWRD